MLKENVMISFLIAGLTKRILFYKISYVMLKKKLKIE